MRLPVYVQQMVLILYLKTSLESALYGKMVSMSLTILLKCQRMIFEIFKYFTANSKKNYGSTNKQGQTFR